MNETDLSVNWFEDEELAIFFNHKPNTHMLEPLPSMSQKEKDMCELYPFINCTSLKVAISDRKKQKSYKFTIPKYFRWDGATIPRLMWRIIGANTNPKFRTPSLIHDYLCCNKYVINFDRKLSSKVFRAMLKVAGVGKLRREVMYLAIELYQGLFCNWGLKFNK